MERICKNPRCNKIVIENWEKGLEENKDARYIECFYCGFQEELIR